ncbi:MAG TPA: DUF1499 domain-containing protein [Stellaceae bacterium]|jgi:hypothetical protein
MATGLLIGLLTMSALGVGLRLFMDRDAENRLRPGEAAALAELRGPLPANAFLACPARYCPFAEAVPSPVFAMGADRLAEYWAGLIAREPRIVAAFAEPEERRFVLIQHSAALRFPDVVTVEFVALGADRSSLAVYSRARYGSYDFGVNRRRVLAWLKRLQQLARPATGQ